MPEITHFRTWNSEHRPVVEVGQQKRSQVRQRGFFCWHWPPKVRSILVRPLSFLLDRIDMIQGADRGSLFSSLESIPGFLGRGRELFHRRLGEVRAASMMIHPRTTQSPPVEANLLSRRPPVNR